MKICPMCSVEFCGPGQICACCEREYYSDGRDHEMLYTKEGELNVGVQKTEDGSY